MEQMHHGKSKGEVFAAFSSNLGENKISLLIVASTSSANSSFFRNGIGQHKDV